MGETYRGKNGSVELDKNRVKWNIDRQKSEIDLTKHQVEVDVDSAGALDKRITATRLILTGPFALGLRKKKDKRELYLLITSDNGESAMLECDPKKGDNARKFAAKVTAASKMAFKAQPASAAAAPGAPATPDAGEQLRKLGELRDAGLITPEEFDAKRAQILERM